MDPEVKSGSAAVETQYRTKLEPGSHSAGLDWLKGTRRALRNTAPAIAVLVVVGEAA